MRMQSRKFRALGLVVATALVVAAAPAPAAAQTAPETFAPAAFVDGRAVTNFDVEQRARLLEFADVTEGRDEEAALQSAIDDRLKRRAAEQAGIEIPAERVQEGLDRFAQAQGLSGVDQLRSRLGRADISLDMVRDYVETELLWTTLVQREFGPGAQISEAELEAEIETSGLDKQVSYSLAEIARAAPGGNRAQVMERMREIAAEIRGGADFGEVARRVSQSPSAPRGGRIGWMEAERLPPQLRAQLENMSPGDITDPFPVEAGVIILSLLDRREEARELSAEDRERIRRRMLDQRLGRLAEGRLQELRARAYVERR